jgi:hypothetical protein
MRATGRSSEEISAALVQLFLNCPAVRPDEAGGELNVDQYADNEVEQQARHDQERVLAALSRRDQQEAPQAQEGAPAPTQAPAAEELVEHAVPKLKIVGQTAVKPFRFSIAVPELEIELRVEVEPSSYCMATGITRWTASPRAHHPPTLPREATEVEPMSEV